VAVPGARRRVFYFGVGFQGLFYKLWTDFKTELEGKIAAVKAAIQ
jgi:hypothetical protein